MLIPPIAAFFGITTDKLLSFDSKISDERLHYYMEKLDELRFKRDNEGL